MTRYDAAIVGGGVAGASCAILLAQAGWSVALMEKETFPRRKVCGECIAASNLALFDALGIGDVFATRAGAPLRRVAWCAGERMIEASLPPLADSEQPWGRALGREHLDARLLDRAREVGATVLQPCTLRAVERVNGRHRCRASAAKGFSRTLDADVLIDAHGSWQRGPLNAGVARAARASDLFAFKANFSGARLRDGVLPVLAFDGGYGGMVQAGDGVLTLACCIRRDRLHRCREQHPHVAAGIAVELSLAKEIRAVRDTIDGARREGAWLAVGPIRPCIARMPAETGVFAVGNAAGEAHPILGEGISMAVQSAFLLCARLIAGERDAVGYARAWRRAFATRIRFAALYAHIAMRPRATRAALPLIDAWPSLLSLGARVGGKTRCAVTAQDAG